MPRPRTRETDDVGPSDSSSADLGGPERDRSGGAGAQAIGDPSDLALHGSRDRLLARDALAGNAAARRTFTERMGCVPRFLAAKNANLRRPLTKEDLEDLSQVTLLSIWKRLESYQGISSLESWAYRFCHLSLCNHLRTQGRRPTHVTEATDGMVGDAPEPTLDHEKIYGAIDQVGAGEARVIRLKHFEQLTFDEIGERLRIPSGTAKTRYYSALERLRGLLKRVHQEGAS